MSFRVRLTLVAAAAVALAVVLASAVVYLVVRGEVRRPVDESLRQRADQVSRLPPDEALRAVFGGAAVFGGPIVYGQFVTASGRIQLAPGEATALPVSGHVLAVATGAERSFLTDVRVKGIHFRLLTSNYGPGTAVQLARPLNEVDRTLRRIRIILLLTDLAGIALAAALGLGVSRAALAPVSRLTRATEKVTDTGDLSERIEARGEDELSRLAGSFNRMLGALEESTRLQRQLVADASHELRTPLTSMRTNIEVLASEQMLPPDERRRLLKDVIEQLTEMTTLIAELIELARGEQLAAEPEDVRLDLLTASAVERARRNRPGIRFETELEESLVQGVPATMERAVANLIDNAAKWSPSDAPVAVAVRGGEVIVRDHGPGIAEEDMPFVFDRFYRASSARGQPGSGLGLAIVKQVADAHGGQVAAEPAPGGGTLIRLRFPTDAGS